MAAPQPASPRRRNPAVATIATAVFFFAIADRTISNPTHEVLMSVRTVLFALLVTIVCLPASWALAQRKTENVFLITTDGLRWQEVFTGAEEALLNTETGGIKKPEPVRKLYWAEKPEDRRKALMPFFWSTVAQQGQIFGNPAKNAKVQITNTKKFSYPGYNELLT